MIVSCGVPRRRRESGAGRARDIPAGAREEHLAPARSTTYACMTPGARDSRLACMRARVLWTVSLKKQIEALLVRLHSERCVFVRTKFDTCGKGGDDCRRVELQPVPLGAISGRRMIRII